MKWSDLTLKERKQIYDAVRAENPNASYFDIKSQFDLIPEYEDGKNRSKWLSDKAYRDSISTLQNSQRFKISKEFKSPTSESKSHMLHLKRALVNEGKIHDWSSKVNQNTIEDFLFDPRNTGVVNNANKLQYNMYRNKSRFVDRINNLTPMEFITPLLLPVAGYETNKE